MTAVYMYTGPHISVWFPVGSLSIRGEELFNGIFVCRMKAAMTIVVMDPGITAEQTNGESNGKQHGKLNDNWDNTNRAKL